MFTLPVNQGTDGVEGHKHSCSAKSPLILVLRRLCDFRFQEKNALFFWRRQLTNPERRKGETCWKTPFFLAKKQVEFSSEFTNSELAKWSCSRNGAALKRIYPKQLEPENPKNPECDSFSANKQPYKMEGCRLSFCGISHHVHPFVDLIDGKKLSAVLREGLSCSAKMKIRISRHKNDETYFWIPRSQFFDL